MGSIFLSLLLLCAHADDFRTCSPWSNPVDFTKALASWEVFCKDAKGEYSPEGFVFIANDEKVAELELEVDFIPNSLSLTRRIAKISIADPQDALSAYTQPLGLERLGAKAKQEIQIKIKKPHPDITPSMKIKSVKVLRFNLSFSTPLYKSNCEGCKSLTQAKLLNPQAN